jgi:radical SAM protein with 4Fe4S-binding SPASM domain
VSDIVTAAPRIISWNITLRCPLKCSHCYVDAGEREAAGVLTTEEAFSVIDQMRRTGTPVVVLSGGEPLLRDDVFEIAAYGTEQGLRMVMGTSGVLLDANTAERLRDAGVKAVAVSLDSGSPTVHDSYRGMKGAWEKAVAALGHCRRAGIGTQVNITVMRPGTGDVGEVVRLGMSLGVRDFQVFLPVPTGRSGGAGNGTPEEYETLIREVLVLGREAGVRLRPTCAPQFRRIAEGLGIRDPGWGRGCIAGISYCRVYADGDVTPCPYLPVVAGNVKKTPFHEIWNNSAVFATLRDPGLLQGKCGRCGFKTVCGGCRARAYRGGGTVSPMACNGLAPPPGIPGELCAGDPFCPYEPGGMTG